MEMEMEVDTNTYRFVSKKKNCAEIQPCCHAILSFLVWRLMWAEISDSNEAFLKPALLK